MTDVIEQEKKNKFYMKIFIGFMVVLSLVTAWIMAKNLNQDISKERFKLTKEYKKIKKEDYVYKAQNGKTLYKNFCLRCHGDGGRGNYTAPPLKGSLIVLNSPEKTAKIIVKGMKGEITRSGRTYNSVMPGFKNLGAFDLAHIYNYILVEFNEKKLNPDEFVHPVEFVKANIDTLTIKGALTESDLKIKSERK